MLTTVKVETSWYRLVFEFINKLMLCGVGFHVLDVFCLQVGQVIRTGHYSSHPFLCLSKSTTVILNLPYIQLNSPVSTLTWRAAVEAALAERCHQSDPDRRLTQRPHDGHISEIVSSSLIESTIENGKVDGIYNKKASYSNRIFVLVTFSYWF
jgi:hypothetical protein